MITPSFGLTATERVLPKLALDFTTAVLDPRITFTRAGATATRVNANGLIEAVAADTPRFDYNPTTLVCKGLLIEESRTNICIDNTALNSGAYFADNATVGVDVLVSPDGTQNADTITTNPSGTGQIYGVPAALPVTPNTVYTASFYAKNISATYVTYGILQSTPTPGWIVDIADPANNYVGQLSTSEWRRITFTFNSGTSTSINFFMASQLPANESLSIWGVQLEAGAFPTSLIFTPGGATATRNADVATMTGTNFSDWFNASEGTFEVDFIQPHDYATNTYIFCASAATDQNQLSLLTETAPRALWYCTSGGAVVTAINAGGLTLNLITKQTAAYKLDDYAMAVNGGNAVLDTSAAAPVGVDRLFFGTNSGGGNRWSGWVQKLKYWPQRLINNELSAFSK